MDSPRACEQYPCASRGFTGDGIGDIGDRSNVPNVTNDDTNPEYSSKLLVLIADTPTITIPQLASEQPLLGLIGDVDIYVVGHHGSETSSTQTLLDEIRPEYGIISSQGPNIGSYNNPDIEVLKRLSALGTQLYATYRSGTIVVAIESDTITLSPSLSERITFDNYKEAA